MISILENEDKNQHRKFKIDKTWEVKSTMEKEISTPAQKGEMVPSEKGSVKKEKKDAKDTTIIGPK